MKQISFNKQLSVEKEEIKIRNNREALIAEIVSFTTEKDKKKLAALIAIKANQMKWTETDLHALLSKRKDPGIYNYTGFVKWSLKTRQGVNNFSLQE